LIEHLIKIAYSVSSSYDLINQYIYICCATRKCSMLSCQCWRRREAGQPTRSIHDLLLDKNDWSAFTAKYDTIVKEGEFVYVLLYYIEWRADFLY